MISIVAAMDLNRVIGIRGGAMPWERKLKDDLKRFKELTQGNTVIYGRKTLTDDIKIPLPNRRNIILSRDPTFKVEGCEVYNSLDQALHMTCKREKLFVIGGAEVFKESLPLAQEMHLTVIAYEFFGDVLFPEFNKKDWELVSVQNYERNDRNAYPFSAQHFVRRMRG